MRKAFVEFLISEGVLPAADAENLRNLLRGAPEPIGSIAFSYGMITGAEIDAVLDEQRDNHLPFGEIAMKGGMLTRGQVDALLRVQQIRAAAEIAEAIALSGLRPINEIVTHLARFFLTKTESPVGADR